MAIPYYTADGGPLIVNGQPFHRLRPDHSKNGAKYLSPAKSGCQLYIPLGQDFSDAKELVIAESEFKALCLAMRSIPAVGLGGFSSGLPGGKMLPALEELLHLHKFETVHFLGDNDTCSNFEFSREAVKLAKALPNGCILKLPRIGVDLPKGIDDVAEHLGEGFSHFWDQARDAAIPVDRKPDVHRLAVSLLRRELPTIKADPNWRDRYLPHIISLAAHLDVMACEDLASEVKDQLGIPAGTFRRAVKEAFKSQQRERESRARASRQQTENHQTEPDGPDGTSETTAVESDCRVVLPKGAIVLFQDGYISVSKSAETIFSKISKTDPPSMFLHHGGVSITEKDGERLKIAPVVAQQFRSLVEDYGSLHGLRVGPHNESLWKIPAVMSIDKAEAILQSHKKALLPKLSLIPQAPVLVVNSQGEPEVLTSGYHPECGGLYIRSRAKLQQEMPYSEAVDLILFLLEDFSFVSPSDKSRAFAAIIAPALRIGRILNCHFPLFAVEADESQAGKGFLLELIHSVYNERVALVLNRKGGVGSLDEEISRVLLAGKPFIQLDNIRDLISSEFFEGVMTCEFGSTVAARVPYSRPRQVDPNIYIFQFTSNRAEFTPDLANRSLIVRILKRKDYAYPEFEEGNLANHVKANHGRFLSAVFTVLTHWIEKGLPQTKDLRGEGRMRQFCQALDWIVRTAGLPPLLEDHQQTQRRASSPALTWLRAIALLLRDQSRLNEEFSAAQLADFSLENGVEIPGLANPNDSVKKYMLRVGLSPRPAVQENRQNRDRFPPGPTPRADRIQHRKTARIRGEILCFFPPSRTVISCDLACDQQNRVLSHSPLPGRTCIYQPSRAD